LLKKIIIRASHCFYDFFNLSKKPSFFRLLLCRYKTIFKNPYRYVQQMEVFWTVSKDWFFASFFSHKALKYPSTYQNMEIVNKSKDGYARI